MVAKDRANASESQGRCCESSDRCELDRRMFVKLGGVGLAALAAAGVPFAAAGPFDPQDTIDHFVPVDKKLRPEWVQGLFRAATERGTRVRISRRSACRWAESVPGRFI